jgi:osmotically-inducible protein OsmY
MPIRLASLLRPRAGAFILCLFALGLVTRLGRVEIGSAAAVAAKPVDDGQLQAAVESELLEEPVVPFNAVDVTVKDGVVTVAGTVMNVLARDRAVEVAAGIRGVKRVVDQLKVRPKSVSDTQLRQDVITALALDPAADSFEMRPEVRDGLVTLKGTVQSFAERELAADVVKGVRGVRGIDNDLAVAWKSTRPDTEIAADIRAKLASNAKIDGGAISVDVRDGVVTLTGPVTSALERDYAVAEAYVAGVKRVEPKLEVIWQDGNRVTKRKGAAPSQVAVTQSIRNALMANPRIDSSTIRVSVARGVATLMGAVDNLAAKREAEDLAQNTVGVWQVKNFIKVRPERPVDDAQIATNVRDTLLRDPVVDRYQIRVAAHQGTVFLHGGVDSEFEKRRAERLAARQKGVVEVRNHLFVPRAALGWNDWQIRREIEDELFWSPFVDANEVKVAVTDGIATLTGRVDSWAELRAAEENALEGGARRVNNRLTLAGRADLPF